MVEYIENTKNSTDKLSGFLGEFPRPLDTRSVNNQTKIKNAYTSDKQLGTFLK